MKHGYLSFLILAVLGLGQTMAQDVGVSATLSGNNQFVHLASTNYDLDVEITNYDGANAAGSFDVYYRIDGGAAVGPINVPALGAGATTNALFTGANALNEVAGSYTIEIYTTLAGDGDISNDTSTYTLFMQVPITTFPYYQPFDLPVVGWTTFGSLDFFGVFFYPWVVTTGTNPNGIVNDNMGGIEFYSANNGTAYLRSLLMDLSGLTNPVVVFQLAYRSYTGEDDQLRVLVSLDGGLTYQATALYDKSQTTVPSMATLAPDAAAFTPFLASNWRHICLDLSAYAGQSNVLIAFEAVTANGNNLYIDNFLVSDTDARQSATINAAGTTTLGPLDLTFTTIGTAGGELEMARINGTPPFTGPTPTPEYINPTGVTCGNGGSPDIAIMYPEGYFIITYSGEDYNAGAIAYNLDLDLVGYTSASDPAQVYLTRRDDPWGSWSAQTTTESGGVISTTGLNTFSDIAAGGPIIVLPAAWGEIAVLPTERGHQVRWQSLEERQSDHFVVERSTSGQAFQGLGQVQAKGEAAHYRFEDTKPHPGLNVYRVKWVNQDGSTQYSDRVEIEFDPRHRVLYPNPAKDRVQFAGGQAGGNFHLELFDLQGRIQISRSGSFSTDGTAVVDVSTLAAGIYFYRLADDTWQLQGKLRKL